MSDIIWAILSFPASVMIVYFVVSSLHSQEDEFDLLDSFNRSLITFFTILYVGTAWFVFNSEAFGYSVDVVKITLDNAALIH